MQNGAQLVHRCGFEDLWRDDPTFPRRGGAETAELEPHGEDNRRGQEHELHPTRLLTPKGVGGYIILCVRLYSIV